MPSFDASPTHDRWGSWVASFVPLRAPDGGIDGVLGVDFEAGHLLQAVRRERLVAMGVLAAVLAVVLVGLASVARLRRAAEELSRRNQELARFSRAPLVIGVISSPKENPKIPQWEMFLSGGMAAMNLIHAANALGYGANMITNWYSDTEEGRTLLGLARHERVIGFVHIGTYEGTAPERPRPDVATLVEEYEGPWKG